MGLCAVDVDEGSQDDTHGDLGASKHLREELNELCTLVVRIVGGAARVLVCRARWLSKPVLNGVVDAISEILCNRLRIR